MSRIFITRQVPEPALSLLTVAGHAVDVFPHDRQIGKQELISVLASGSYEGLLSLLTDPIDAEVLDAAPSLKAVANYAVGFNNIDLAAAKARGILVMNTPGVLTDTVAEHAVALMLALAHRIPESDRYTREGKYEGWAPMLLLGTDLTGKRLGILGAGRIGERVAHIAARGLSMQVSYYDLKQSETLEREYGATFCRTPEELLAVADVVSVHVPLLPTTTHLLNAERLALMKKTALLVNTSRGPVIDEAALVMALRSGTIAGAALDVFENEPALAPGLADLQNAVLTPHTASATVATRAKMAELAAQGLIDALAGRTPAHLVPSP